MMRDFLSNVDRFSGSLATFVLLPKRLLAFGSSLSGNLGQISDSYQVVGGGSELEDPTHQPQSAVSGLAQQSHRLQPAKDFFHSFALTLTNFITRVAGSPLIDRASSSFVVLSHVGRPLAGTRISDKVFRVVSFLTAHSDHLLLPPFCQHPHHCSS